MNIAIDNAPSQHIEIMIYERQTKRRQSERRKAYMRNIWRKDKYTYIGSRDIKMYMIYKIHTK